MSNGLPPGVSSNDPHFTGEIIGGSARVRVTFTVEVVVYQEGDKPWYQEDACAMAEEEALELVRRNDPRVDVETEFL